MHSFAATWPQRSLRRDEGARTVYVIDVGAGSLAFEAQDRTHAEDITRSPWFVQALDRFCPEEGRSAIAGHHLRTASVREELSFQDIAAEFADATGEFLVARLA